MKATKKMKRIERFLFDMTGVDRAKIIESNLCMFCNNKVNQSSFRDEISRKEYSISGMCQECQDSYFGKEEE